MKMYKSLYGSMFEYEKDYENNNLIRLEGMDYDTSIFKIPKIYKYAIDLMFKHNTLTYSDFGGFKRFQKLIRKYENYKSDLNNKDNFIFVGSGVSNLIYPIIESILTLDKNKDRKDIMVFEPDYPIFKSVIKKVDGNIISVKSNKEDNFLVKIEEIEKKITKNTSAIIFSYPNNPTCNFQDHDFFEKLVQISKEKDIFLISDEIYRDTFYDQKEYVNIAKINNGYKNFVRVYGISKDRPGMTGMRCAYCIADKSIEVDFLNNQLLRNFSGNIIAEYIFMIDIALRYYKISGEKFEDFKYFPNKLIKQYFKTIRNNKNKQEKINNEVVVELQNNQNVIDIIKPSCGNSVLFRYKQDMGANELNQLMIQKGLAIYPYDVFSFTIEDGSWCRICVTRDFKYIKRGIKKI